MKLRVIIAVSIAALGIFWPQIEANLLNDKGVNKVDYNKILNLKEPSKDLREELKDFKDIVSGPSEEVDRELIAIFNIEMSKRLSKYNNVTTLQFENYYADAGKNFYQGRISNKYNELGNRMYQIVLSTLGENEAVLKKEEMENLSKKMSGISWILLN